MKRRVFLCSTVLLLWAAGCTNTPTVPSAPIPGDTDFTSAAPDQGGHYDTAGTAEDSNGRQEPAAAEGENQAQREIEEADIVKIVGNTLYALNSYRGLYLIDMSNPDSPAILGHQEMYGFPVEMYVRNGRAFVILSNYFRIWALTDGSSDPEVGSSVVVVDVQQPQAPLVLSRFHMPGYVTDTRIVGDVLYTVSNRYWWFWYYGNDDSEDTTTVMSINLADPFNIHQVDSYTFNRCDGWDNHIHVTTEAIYVASSCWEYDGYATQLRYVDISDPAGQMALGAQIQFPGVVRDRWALSEHENVLRVISGETWWSTESPTLRTFQVNTPTDIEPLQTMQIQLPRPESITATRFDGERAYVVTYERIDPLYTLDLSDPAHPLLAGELEMPGWLDHVVPRGDRLVALGHDEVDGETRLAVSLFNVADLTNPILLDRVHFGEGWGWLTDERDNFDKVFKVLDDSGLILVPFMEWIRDDDTYYYGHYRGGVQLIDWNTDDLVLRGHAAHEGYIRRALVYAHRLVTLSDQKLQVLNIADRDNPTLTGELSLSRNVVQFAVVGNHTVQLVGDWWTGDTKLVVLPLSDPDLGTAVAELTVEAPYARFFTHDEHVFVVYRDMEDGTVRLQSVDLSDPTTPALAGTLDLPEAFNSYGYYYGWWWWGWYWGGWGWWYPRYDSVLQVDGDKLLFHASRCWWYCYPGSECDPDEVLVVDLANPDAPALAAQLSLTNRAWINHFMADGSTVIFTHFQHTDYPDANGNNLVRYYMNRLDLSDPYHPQLHQPVNVPGVVIDANLTTGRIITEDFQWTADSTWQRSINTLQLWGDVALLRGRVVLPENSARVLVEGDRALFARNTWTWDEDAQRYRYESSFQGIDLSDITDPRLTAEVPLQMPYNGVYMIVGDKAVLGTWWYLTGLMVYDVSNLDYPVFQKHVPTRGWISDMVPHGSNLYVATGPYGVRTIPLDNPPEIYPFYETPKRVE
jgi:uncharacterized secreted protein with C-terminal beta-propeller domain